MSLKIAVLLNTRWNVYNFRKGLVHAFLKDGHSVVVIAPTDEYTDQLMSWGVTCIDVEMQNTGTNPIKDLWYFRQLNRILKAQKPDVLLSFTIKPNIYGSFAARHLKIPIISNVSGLGTTFLWKSWVQHAAVLLYQQAFKRTDFIFFQNKDDQALFLENVKVGRLRIGLVPGSGINLEEFQCTPPTFQKPIKFLMIARLIVEKGVMEFFEAARQVHQLYPEVKFELIGKYEPEHQRGISEMDYRQIVNCDFLSYPGHVNEVKNAIENADVIVLPSYREGTPRTLLEAAAMSRVLIATDVPGCREVVENGKNGYLCEVRNADSLASKMKQFLSLPVAQQTSMAEYSRRLVETKFDESVVIKAYQRKVNELVK